MTPRPETTGRLGVQEIVELMGRMAAAPVPARDAVDAQEAEWFRWLRDNPQAAAYITVLVAKLGPMGPNLAASMNSGEVVGVMEDAKQPEYRFRTDAPMGFEITDWLMAAVEQGVAACVAQAIQRIPTEEWSVNYAQIVLDVVRRKGAA